MLERLRAGLTRLQVQGGFSLVEVLVALLLLVLVLSPTMNAIRSALYSGKATQARSQAISLARTRVAQLRAIAYDNISLLDDPAEEVPRYGDDMTGDPDQAKFRIDTVVDTEIETAVNPATGDTPALVQLRLVRVTVSCPGCAVRHGDSNRPITLVSVVRGRLDDEW